jgi:hypothetical protein
MKPRKLAVSERETAEFPGIMQAGVFFQAPASKKVVADGRLARATRQLRRGGEPDEDKA